MTVLCLFSWGRKLHLSVHLGANSLSLSLSFSLYIYIGQGIQEPTPGYQLSQIARVKPTHSLTSVHFAPCPPRYILTFSLYLSLTISLPFCRLTTTLSFLAPSIPRIPLLPSWISLSLSLLGYLLGWTERPHSPVRASS